MLEFFLSHAEMGALVLVAAAIWGWDEGDFRARPMFISRAEIGRMADELDERYGTRAEEVAFIEEEKAWRRAESYQQGVWRRVRKQLRRGRWLDLE